MEDEDRIEINDNNYNRGDDSNIHYARGAVNIPVDKSYGTNMTQKEEFNNTLEVDHTGPAEDNEDPDEFAEGNNPNFEVTDNMVVTSNQVQTNLVQKKQVKSVTASKKANQKQAKQPEVTTQGFSSTVVEPKEKHQQKQVQNNNTNNNTNNQPAEKQGVKPEVNHNKKPSLNFTDDEEDDFDCQKHSKAIFNVLNGFKQNYKSLKNKLKSFKVPESSDVSQGNVNSLLSQVEHFVDTKGNSYLWNEKGFGALSECLENELNEDTEDSDLQEVYNSWRVGKQIVFSLSVNKRYTVEETALLLLLSNPTKFTEFLGDKAPYLSVAYYQTGPTKNLKARTYAVFSS